MLLRQLWCESTVKFVGRLPTVLGNGQDMTINLGGEHGRSPMLYAPFPLSAIRQLRNKLSKCKIIPPQYGKHGAVDCTKKSYSQTKLAHVGEAHCTIQAFKIDEILKRLKHKHGTDNTQEALMAAGLFDRDGNGAKFPMRIKKGANGPDFLVVHSFAYKDEWDNTNNLPIAIGIKVHAPYWEAVHNILGTNPYPVLPNGDTYTPHITIGYMHNRQPSPESEEESPADIRKQIRKSYDRRRLFSDRP